MKWIELKSHDENCKFFTIRFYVMFIIYNLYIIIIYSSYTIIIYYLTPRFQFQLNFGEPHENFYFKSLFFFEINYFPALNCEIILFGVDHGSTRPISVIDSLNSSISWGVIPTFNWKFVRSIHSKNQSKNEQLKSWFWLKSSLLSSRSRISDRWKTHKNSP